MGVKMSAHFCDAAKDAASALSDENPKAYLRKPFSGFYVTLDSPQEFFTSFEQDGLVGREGRTIFVICESLLGRPDKTEGWSFCPRH
jgi:hypothetical protein